MNDIVYIDHMKIADRPVVAILDMQVSKVPIISGYAYLVPPSCLCGILALRSHDFWEMTLNSKTLVRYVYVLPEVLHGDFLSEIKYLFNLEGNILHILTRNVIFFYDYSNWGGLPFNILPSNYFNVSIFRWSLCHFYEIIRLLLCFFSGLYFPPKHYGENIRSASGFFIAGNPFVKIPGFPFLHFRLIWCSLT